MNSTIALLLCAVCIAASSCAPKSVDPGAIPPEAQRDLALMPWPYQQNGVVLNLAAEPDLNSYDNAPHTIMMCVYELSSRDAFDNLAQTRPGIESLLACNNFDNSVIMTGRHIIRPGTKTSLTLARQENAKFIALAGGFYNLNQQRATILKAIPVVESSDGSLWWQERRFNPAVLDLNVALGSDGMDIMQPAAEK